MAWVTEQENVYWMPDSLPEPTEEYNELQKSKRYLTSDNHKKNHPGWTYSNTAFVCDDYLFNNEGWKVILEDAPNIELKNVVENDSKDWEIVDDKTLRVTYTIVDFTEQELEDYKNEKWEIVRDLRNLRLKETDYIVTRSVEEGLSLSQEIKDYRKNLRDLPEVIDILTFDPDNGSLWPIIPTNLFGA